MPDKVHRAHILVKTEPEAKAVLDRLNKGEKFANIAKKVSLCPLENMAEIWTRSPEGKWLRNSKPAHSRSREGKLQPS